ncbi:MAG: type II toxin-antitoxin system VapC family toxin [Wenzhouxiangellaceae bacterium]
MIAVDTNILVYAHREDSPFHTIACKCIEMLATGPGAWAIPWPCLHEFQSVVTHPRVFDPPTPLAAALGQVDAWMESPGLQLIGETMHHWPTLGRLIRDAKIVGPRVHDARIAAICLQHGINQLWSADRDFSAFPALRVVNPCVE